MTATNHMIAGSVIALAVDQPVLAVPIAFASHFALDALPHFGYPGNRGFEEIFKRKAGLAVAVLDVIGLVLLTIVLLPGYLTAFLIGLVALSPDVMWLIRYLFYERQGKIPPTGSFTRFHQAIQRWERPWGIVVELVLMAVMAVLLLGKL